MVLVGVGVLVGFGVLVGVGILVIVGVGVLVGAGVLVGVGVALADGVGVGPAEDGLSTMLIAVQSGPLLTGIIPDWVIGTDWATTVSAVL